jgi:hypothetical protein
MANCKVGFISERRYNLTCKISVRDATSGVYRVGRRAHKLREVLFYHILYQCSLMAEYGAVSWPSTPYGGNPGTWELESCSTNEYLCCKGN